MLRALDCEIFFTSPPAGPLAAGLERDFCRCRLEVLHLFENWTAKASRGPRVSATSLDPTSVVAFSLLERYFLLARPHTRAHRLIHTSGAAKSPDSNGDDSDGANKRKGGPTRFGKAPRSEARNSRLTQTKPPRAQGEGGGVWRPSLVLALRAAICRYETVCERDMRDADAAEHLRGDIGRYGEIRGDADAAEHLRHQHARVRV